MRTMDDDAFQAWLAEGGIENRARTPGALVLAFPGAREHPRTWPAPGDTDALRRWLAALVRAASPEGPWWLRRRYGPAWWSDEAGLPNAKALDRASSVTDVPRGFRGALGFDADEAERMMGVLESYATWEWGMGEDLWLVPADRSCLVLLCHDEEVHVACASAERLAAFAEVVREHSGTGRSVGGR